MNNKRIGRIFHHINPKREPKLYEPEEDYNSKLYGK